METSSMERFGQNTAPAASHAELRLNPLEFLSHLLAHWKLIVCCVFACAAVLGLCTMFLMTPEYEATAKMYVLSSSDSVVNLSDLQLGTYLASDYQEVFTTHEVTRKVISNLNLPYTQKQLQRMLTLSNPSGTRILHIKIRSANPVEAASIANEYLKVASQYISDVMLTDKPTVLSSAQAPTLPVGPSLLRNTVVGALLGMILSGLFLLIWFLVDDKVKTGDQLTKLTGLPVLAQIPLFSAHDSLEQSNRKIVSGRNDTL